ncbi:MAG: hypothetical protein RL377_1092 [Bacteroidota bacterium]
MSAPLTAIVLVNWNGLQDTIECIESLYASSDHNFEIFLVDNASTISPEQTIQSKFPKVNYIASSTNLGFTGGNNFALEHILKNHFEYVLFLNNDTILDPHFLAPLLQAFDQNPQLNAVQPCIYYHQQPTKIWSAGGKWNQWIGDAFTMNELPQNKQITYPDWITGCAMMVKTSAIQQTGGFNIPFFAYYEDVELSFRLNQDKNQLAMVPTSIIWHKVGGSVHTPNKEGNLNPMVHYWNWRNRIWVMKKYQSPLLLLFNLILLIPKFIFTCSYFIARARWNKLKLTCKGFLDGLRYSIN